MKPGNETSEYQLTKILNAIFGILTALALVGLITIKEQEAYMKAAEAIMLGAGPLAMSIITAVYSNGRAKVKVAHEEKKITYNATE